MSIVQFSSVSFIGSICIEQIFPAFHVGTMIAFFFVFSFPLSRKKTFNSHFQWHRISSDQMLERVIFFRRKLNALFARNCCIWWFYTNRSNFEKEKKSGDVTLTLGLVGIHRMKFQNLNWKLIWLGSVFFCFCCSCIAAFFFSLFHNLNNNW